MHPDTDPSDTTEVERFTISAHTYRIVATIALVLVAVIVVTGAALAVYFAVARRQNVRPLDSQA